MPWPENPKNLPRTTCPACKIRLIAINYVKKGKVHYRSVCDHCARIGKKPKPDAPTWLISGYKKKDYCEKCGFRAKHSEQMDVYYINGNTSDANWFNLRSVCTNCQIDIKKSKLRWKPSDITPDF